MKSVTWTHKFKNFSADAEEACAWASVGNWKHPRRVTLFRNFAATTIAVIGQLQPTPATGRPEIDVAATPPRSEAGAELSRALLLTFVTLSCDPGTQSPRSPSASFVTQPPTDGQGEAGWAPWLIATVAICSTIGIAAVAWCAREAAPVIDRHLMRIAETQQLMAFHAQLTRLAQDHADRERAAGTPIALNEAEKSAIETLSTSQRAVLAKISDEKPYTPTPLLSTPSIFALVAGVGIVGLILFNSRSDNP